MPLFWLSLAFIAGVVLGRFAGLGSTVWFVLAGIFLLAFAIHPLWRRIPFLKKPLERLQTLPTLPLPASLLLGVLFLGAARMALAQPVFSTVSLAAYNDLPERVAVEGVVAGYPEVQDEVQLLHFQADRLVPLGKGPPVFVEGSLLARLSSTGEWQYGDRLRLEGYLATPPEFEGFSYRGYLARRGIYSYMSNVRVLRIGTNEGSLFESWIWRLRSHALDLIYRFFPDPEAGLMAGILLGVEGGIPEALMDDFRATGTSHIIAISGFNMAIVAGLFAVLFSRAFGRRWGALAAILGIALYTLLVGAAAGVVRSAIMAGLALFAAQVGRRQQGVNSLALVAAVMALFTPYVLWDVSFQLSFAATLGLVLFAEPFTEAFRAFASRFLSEAMVKRLVGPVGEYVLFTLAAMVTTLPLMVFYFEQLSLVSLVANPLVLPAQPLLMILGGLAVLVGLVFPPLGQFLAYLAFPFPAYTIRVVEALARVPNASLATGVVSIGWLVLFYAALFSLVFLRDRLPALQKLWKPSLLLLVLVGLAVAAWRGALSTPDGNLHLVVLDVGSGDAVLIQTPGGRRVLVDGGPSPNTLSDALGRRLPLGSRRLDWLVVAGAGEAQVGGLPRTLERFPAQDVLWSGSRLGSYSARALLQEIGRLGIPIHQAQSGHSLDLGDGAQLKVLAVTSRGMVLLLEWGSFRALLPIGLDFESMENLEPGALSALLMAESGYAPLNTPEWIESLQPQVVLLSVGAGDRDGLPDPQALQAVEGYSLLRTDESGWIELITDGERIWVEVER